MTTEKMFPERQRCRTCGKKLGALVVEGLYCCYKCGGFPEPYGDNEIDLAPRQCKTMRNNKWEWKKRWRCESEVPQRIANDPATNIYRCSHCRCLHVGHDRAQGHETARIIRDSETLGSVLQRARTSLGKTRKDVAVSIGVRPIRIKEIEEDSPKIETATLFKLLDFYHMKMNVLLG